MSHFSYKITYFRAFLTYDQKKESDNEIVEAYTSDHFDLLAYLPIVELS